MSDFPCLKMLKNDRIDVLTDFSILKSHGLATLARSRAPAIADSVQAVNRMLKTADNKVHFFVAPNCVNTIKSIERTSWKENNPEALIIDKAEGIEHWTDGIRYAVEYLFPVRNHAQTVKRGFSF